MPIPTNIESESERERILRKVWTLRGDRFEAFRRMTRTGNASRWTITLASVGLVGLNILSHVGAPQDAASLASVALWSLIGAVGIVVISSLESGVSYELIADRHHRAGRALTELYDRATIEEVPTVEIMREYHAILERFEDNHLPVDHAMFACAHPKDFKMTTRERIWTWLMWHVRANWPWLLSGIVAGLLWGVS